MKTYYLLFVEDDDNTWGFYGFYWHKGEMESRLAFAKERFKNHKIVEGEVNL